MITGNSYHYMLPASAAKSNYCSPGGSATVPHIHTAELLSHVLLVIEVSTCIHPIYTHTLS